MKLRRFLIGMLLLPGLAIAALAAYEALFTEVTETHLPVDDLIARSMDAKPIDVEEDGDQDLMIAIEHEPNILLINDGEAASERAYNSFCLPVSKRDSLPLRNRPVMRTEPRPKTGEKEQNVPSHVGDLEL